MKNNLQKKATLINIISNIILQIANILSWFIIPKIILSYFGSNVNGLVSSISQFLSYISLIEGGITSVIMANMYKPLMENDKKKISSIIKTSKQFYQKIGIIFILYSLILAITYPLIFRTHFNFTYVFTLILILSISLLIQYMFSLTFKNLLNADKKGYIVSLTQTLIIILNIILSYISVILFPSIHILKLISGTLFILQPFIYKRYIKKNYIIDEDIPEDKNLLKERWSGFAINIAAFIHNCTDIIILTIFTNLNTVSVYSIYTIITNGLRAIFNAISNAIVPTIGRTYVRKNLKDLNEKMDLYEFITFNFIFLIFTVAAFLITPFIMIYTKNINDANYNQVIFGVLLVISEALYLIKFPHLNLSYSTNKFKDLTLPCFIEAFINIIISLALVQKLGLIGVTIGTICGMLYRLVYQVYYSTKIIPNRPQKNFYKKLFIYSFGTIIGILIAYIFIPLTTLNIFSWISNAMIYTILFSIIYLIIDAIFFKKEILYLKNYILRR